MRFFATIALCACAVAAAHAVALPAARSERFALAPEHYTFADYLDEFGKAYDAYEHHFRRGIFDENLRRIKEVNADPTKTWRAGVNQFTDMTPAERAAFKGYRSELRGLQTLHTVHTNRSTDDLPEEVDWRKKGVTTPVKNQGQCGSCWAFSTAEVVESAVAISTGSLMKLSEQQLVSCAPNPQHCGGTGGCEGSTQWVAMDYIKENGGMTLESDYKYTARDSACNKASIKKVATIDDVVRLPANDYQSLLNAVATVGPIAISVAADKWFMYESGVFGSDDPKECGFSIDHAVVAEGYGVATINGKSVNYWLVRNSWGPGWGEDGYIRVLRSDGQEQMCGTDKDPASGTGCKGGPSSLTVCGVCGILSDSSYPTGARLV